MDRNRSRQLVAGSLVVTAIASVAMGIGSLSGFSSTSTGDSLAAPMNGEALAILFVGTLTILGLERAHLSGRQSLSRARVARAANEPSATPYGSTAGPSKTRRYAGVK
jgi:hypothetical protein